MVAELDRSTDALADWNRVLADASPRAVLQWAFGRWAPYIALATGFGPSGVVLMHLVARLRPHTTVFYLDTDLLFPETLALRDRLTDELGLRFTRVHSGLPLSEQALAYGPELWHHSPDRCCAVRKVAPLRRFLATQQAWITGLRRDQSPSRRSTRLAEWDAANGLFKINPLAGWTEQMVWNYIRLEDLPYNELHDDGYPSLGCMPCTRAVAPSESRRAGRWPGHPKLECGIHRQIEPRA